MDSSPFHVHFVTSSRQTHICSSIIRCVGRPKFSWDGFSSVQ